MNPLMGIGLRHPHYQQVPKERPPIRWFEVHSENFFQGGGPVLNSSFDQKILSNQPTRCWIFLLASSATSAS